MARIRTVKPEFFQHEELGALPFEARLLAIGLMQLADGHGRLRWVPKLIEAHVFPWDEGIDLEALAQGLEGAGLIARYRSAQRQFAHFANWRKHQRIQGKEVDAPSRYPAPEPGEDTGDSEVNDRGSDGESPGCFPGNHPVAQEQGTGNREQGTCNAQVRESVEEEKPSKKPRAARPSEYRARHDDAPALCAVYREFRPKAGKRPPRGEPSRLVDAALDEVGLDACSLVIRWAYGSPQARAVNLREGGWVGLDSLFRAGSLDAKLAAAEQWEREGSREHSEQVAVDYGKWWASGEARKLRRDLDSLALFNQSPDDPAAWMAAQDGAPPLAWLRGVMGGAS